MTTVRQHFSGTAAEQIINAQPWTDEQWEGTDNDIRDVIGAIQQNGNDPQIIAAVINHVGSDRGWSAYRDTGPDAATAARVRTAMTAIAV